MTPVAALGNESFNVSDGSFMQDFIMVPGEVSGVVGVSATGYFNLKASYSNYGTGKTDVSAPGGDGFVQTTPSLPGAGNVLGAWAPDNTALPGALYVFTSGTSMACPNAAGVCALIISQYGDFTPDNSQKLHMSPQHVEAILQQTANNQPCPDPNEVTYFLASPPFPRTRRSRVSRPTSGVGAARATLTSTATASWTRSRPSRNKEPSSSGKDITRTEGLSA